MSASQGQRDAGGRGRVSRARGTYSSRGARGQFASKSAARLPGRSSSTPSTTVEPTHGNQTPPAQHGYHRNSRKSSPLASSQSRGSSNASRASTSPPPPGPVPFASKAKSTVPPTTHMADVYQKLRKDRDQERRDAIKNGHLADPDRPTSLADAITPVGTCPDMCPRFERVERIVQQSVDGCERPTSSSGSRYDEGKMVKRFRRSAAGYDEQLPSDIRPPLVLQKTLDYLISDIVGGQDALANVHLFVWDRTRAIRNDFSIQQVTKLEEIRIAIDCFERIARFHILSLHLLSDPDRDNGEFDHHQEREQLNNTLLSLMYYYDDSRHKLTSPNEAEFRAYCIIFEIQDLRPDLEDRAQQWPRSLLRDQRVQTALRLYAAAGNISDDQGPLRPRTAFAVAQANTGRFWGIVRSNAVSYIMACVTEMYFESIRRTALEAIWKAYKGKRGGAAKMEDWGLSSLTSVLGFDDEQQTQAFVEEHGFSIAEREDGEAFIDLGSVTSRQLSDSNPRRKQIYSKSLVEPKRLDRTLPAIINGLGAYEAQRQGLISKVSHLYPTAVSKRNSLFIPEDSDEGPEDQSLPSKVKSQSEPTAGTMMRTSSSEATRPRTSFDPVGRNSMGSDRPTTVGIFPHTKAKPDEPSSSPFGRPSSAVSGTPAFSPNSAPSPTVSEHQPSQQSSSSHGVADSGAMHKSRWSGIKDTISLVDSPHSFKNVTSPPFGTLVSSTNGTSSPTLGNQMFHQGTNADLKQPSSEPLENGYSQETNQSVSLTSKSNVDDSNVTQPEENQPSTNKLPVSEGLFSPRVFTPISEISSAMSQETNTPGESVTTSFNPFKPQVSSSIDLPVVPQPWASLAPTQNAATPTTVDKHRRQAPISTDLRTPPQTMSIGSNSVTENKVSVNSGSMIRPSSAAASPLNRPNSDRRTKVINKLCEAVMHEDEGLLQQFVEYMINPIINDAIHQIKDEQSWKQAKLYRSVLLAKKYSRIWKKNSWKLGLLRKGRHRRKLFAQSMHELARSNGNSHMLSASEIHPKRTSLPAGPDVEHSARANVDENGKDRMHDDSQMASTRNVGQMSRLHHKRSNTVATHGQLELHDQEGRAPRLSDSRTARALIHGRSDTTRTDYFRLKALGINPDTPLVPRTTKKRPRVDDVQSEEKRIRTSTTPTKPGGQETPSPVSQIKSVQSRSVNEEGKDSEDIETNALLSQMRSVRDTMSESILFFERAKSQLTSSNEERPDSYETAKQRRLREFVVTPSRTGKRHRLTKAHAWLPKEWDAKSSRRDERGRNSASIGPAGSESGSVTSPFDSEASSEISNERQVGVQNQSKKVVMVEQTGASVEDAIEL